MKAVECVGNKATGINIGRMNIIYSRKLLQNNGKRILLMINTIDFKFRININITVRKIMS
jgi:hypothetical protein